MKAFIIRLKFLMAYARAYHETESHAEAIEAGLTKLSERKPFDILSPADIKRIVPIWSLIPDPQTAGALVANIVRQNNVAAMKDKWFLDQLAKKYRELNRQRSKR